MIPKQIHYCWFGEKPLPKSAKKCISSWKKYFPDYEIKEWNESNYDVKKTHFTAEAYAARKYAFVSDFARFDILFHQGGVYFDTDVEVIKPFDDILEHGPFMGCEKDIDEKGIDVAPGLGMAANPGLGIYEEILHFYSTKHFLNADRSLNTETVVKITTRILTEHGLRNDSGIQVVEGITIYPKEFFNPKDEATGELIVTDNTHSIHWYDMSWLPYSQRLRKKVLNPIRRALRIESLSRRGRK